MSSNDLEMRMNFLVEVEKLKMIYRQNMIVDGSRHENSAEHSWHIAVMAVVLNGYSDNKDIDLLRVIKMLLIHDIVEIDAGDTFLYDAAANQDKPDKETESAGRIFGMLPPEQRDEFMGLWKEFEERQTADALFAAALDGMHPLMNHFASDGIGIRHHGLKTGQVVSKKQYIGSASKELWDYSREIIRKSEEAGFYSE